MTNSDALPTEPNQIEPIQSEAKSDRPTRLRWQDYFSFSTDHKVIGIQYLVTTFFFFLIGGLLAMLIRAELITPQLNLVSRQLYNGIFTLHGTMMIFLWIIPCMAGFANYLVPLMIGARDMAFPALNAIAFWIIPPAGLLLLSSFFLPSGARHKPDGGLIRRSASKIRRGHCSTVNCFGSPA